LGKHTSLLSASQVSETVLQRARDYGLDGLLVIGGDGTMRIAQEMLQKGLHVVGVPKPLITTSTGPRLPWVVSL